MTNYTITTNAEFNSLELSFSAIPTQEERNALKTIKFRWNPIKKIWYGFATIEEVQKALNGEPVQAAARPTKAEKPEPKKYNWKEESKKFGAIDTTDTEGYLGAPAYKGSNCHTYDLKQIKSEILSILKGYGIKATCSIKGYRSLYFTIYDNYNVIKPAKQIEKEITENVYDWERCYWLTYVNEAGKIDNIHVEKFMSLSKEEQDKYIKMIAEYETGYILDGNDKFRLNHFHIENDLRITKEAKEKYIFIQNVISSFNYDKSNSMVDYFDTNFYYDIDIKIVD